MSTKPASPQAWLWQELARRFGDEAARELREGFNAVMAEYSRHRRTWPPNPAPFDPRAPRKRKKEK